MREKRAFYCLLGPERQKENRQEGCIPWSFTETLVRRVVENEIETAGAM